jgi:hypothetical protein
MASASDITTG